MLAGKTDLCSHLTGDEWLKSSGRWEWGGGERVLCRIDAHMLVCPAVRTVDGGGNRYRCTASLNCWDIRIYTYCAGSIRSVST